jgi:hypothetical protein
MAKIRPIWSPLPDYAQVERRSSDNSTYVPTYIQHFVPRCVVCPIVTHFYSYLVIFQSVIRRLSKGVDLPKDNPKRKNVCGGKKIYIIDLTSLF